MVSVLIVVSCLRLKPLLRFSVKVHTFFKVSAGYETLGAPMPELAQLRDWLGIQDATYPPIGCAILAFALAYALFSGRSGEKRLDTLYKSAKSNQGERAALAALFALAAVYAYNYFRYLLGSFYLDHVEPQIAALSWLLARGDEVYHSVQAPERYTTIYGPAIYLLPALFMKIAGPSILTSKLASTAAALASPPLLYLALRDVASRARSKPRLGPALGTAFFIVTVIAFTWMSVWIRAESAIVFVTCASLFAATRKEAKRAALGLGTCLALAANFKATTPFYLVPAFAYFLTRAGFKLALLATIGGLAAAALPWLLPNVSLTNYIEWIRLNKSGHGLDPFLSQGNANWAMLLFAAPAAAVLATKRPTAFLRANALLSAALALATLVAWWASAVQGSGMYHLLPLAPIYCFYVALALREGVAAKRFWISFAIGFGIALSARAWIDQATLMQMYRHGAQFEGLEEDLLAYVKGSGGTTVAVGYGNGADYSNFRPVPVFEGHPYLIDEAAYMGMLHAGLEMPEATRQALASCRIRTWLIPRGNPPFQFYSFYAGQRPLFDEAFRQSFLASYQNVGATQFFDVWTCKASP